MEQKSHILITQKFLDECLQNGIFGVTDKQINYLSNIEQGNTIFLYETSSGRFVGPFTVSKSLFKNISPIWKTKNGIDPFINRIQFEGKEAYESDLSVIWKLLFQRNNTKMFTFNTFQRSSITLFNDEYKILIDSLKLSGTTFKEVKRNVILESSNCDYFKHDTKIFSSEARLEAFLIKNKSKLTDIIEEISKSNLSDYELINQLSLPGLNYNIDIILFGDKIVIIELKKDQIDKNTIQQLEKYKKYWENSSKDIILIAIGSSYDNIKNSDIFKIKYEIKDKNVKLTSESGIELLL